MPTSTCPKCPGTDFELKEGKIKGANFRLMFVQCSSCGAVIGIQDFYNLGQLILTLGKKLNLDLTRK